MKIIVQLKNGGTEHDATLQMARTSAPSRPFRPTEKIITELGSPVEPIGARKNCGTDLVWPVLRILKPEDVTFEETPYVCRHQIIAGD
jgi:hypothetical protein